MEADAEEDREAFHMYCGVQVFKKKYRWLCGNSRST
jgi:hypothetical protein